MLSLSKLNRLVNDFNARHPVGSWIVLVKHDGPVRVRVRAPAEILNQSSAVGWFEGVSGAYSIEGDRVWPAPELLDESNGASYSVSGRLLNELLVYFACRGHLNGPLAQQIYEHSKRIISPLVWTIEDIEDQAPELDLEPLELVHALEGCEILEEPAIEFVNRKIDEAIDDLRRDGGSDE